MTTPSVPPVVSTTGDVENLAEQARKLLARKDLDPDIRTRLDAALMRLRDAADDVTGLLATAEWFS